MHIVIFAVDDLNDCYRILLKTASFGLNVVNKLKFHCDYIISRKCHSL